MILKINKLINRAYTSYVDSQSRDMKSKTVWQHMYNKNWRLHTKEHHVTTHVPACMFRLLIHLAEPKDKT